MAAVISSTAGTRITPIDGYTFVRGTTAVFKIIFLNDGIPTTVDVGTDPTIKILKPKFLSHSTLVPIPEVVAEITGSLEPGQDFEYRFEWNIPGNTVPNDQYIVSYQAQIGGLSNNYGDEYFTINGSTGQVGIRQPAYATVDDVRKKKFNIDSYLPESLKPDLAARNNIIEDHLRDATKRLREELNIAKARGNSENYRLFTVYYTIWSILLASRGEDGSSVSDSNITFWRTEWERILAQEKRESQMQGIPLGRG